MSNLDSVFRSEWHRLAVLLDELKTRYRHDA
jgi:hypothetical protein